MNGFMVGSKVVTRRGKRGVVETFNTDGKVNVRFGSKVFAMRQTQVICAAAYDRMGKGYSPSNLR